MNLNASNQLTRGVWSLVFLTASLLLLASGCSKDLDLESKTWPCSDDSECPGTQVCVGETDDEAGQCRDVGSLDVGGMDTTDDTADSDTASDTDGSDAPDQDGDGVPDADDNCISVPNPDQSNIDRDDEGDACDDDRDGDGFGNEPDVCPDVPDPQQTDSDNDGVGDACDRSRSLGNVPTITGIDDGHVGSALAGPIDINNDGHLDLVFGEPLSSTVYVVPGDGSRAFQSTTETSDRPAMAITGDGQLGTALAVIGDVDNDTFLDIAAGAPTRDDTGRAHLIRGRELANLPNDVNDSSNATVSPPQDAMKFGGAVAAGDIDDDGSTEVFIADADRDNLAGQVYQLEPTGTSNIDLGTQTPSPPTLSGAEGSQTGRALAVVESLNADTYPDLIVGAKGESTAYIFFGGPDFELPGSVSGADVTVVGVSNTDFGQAVSGAGDINGDGASDFMISQTGTDGGQVYVFFGWSGPPPSDQIAAATDADIVLEAEAAGHRAGSSLAAVGDIDGDGITDLAIGATELDDTGENAGGVYLFFGGELRDRTGAVSLADAVKFTSPEPGAFSGNAVTGIGDFDDDGFDDLAVGSVFAATMNGAVHVIFGPVLGAE
jgi:hypothetical protein